jgi:chromosome partitioning protein
MGKIVLIGGQKGGTGKSTLATNLAAYRLSKASHNNILLVDTDLQGSTANWTYFRRQNNLDGIECIQLFGKRIKSEIDSKKKHYDDIIIDAGGRDSQELRYAMLKADIMIIPFGASQHDISTATDMEELIGNAKDYNENLKSFAVINRMRNHARLTGGDQAIFYLRKFNNFQALDFIIHERVSYSRSARMGRGVSEILNKKGQPKDQKAIEEIKQLYEVVYGLY